MAYRILCLLSAPQACLLLTATDGLVKALCGQCDNEVGFWQHSATFPSPTAGIHTSRALA